MALMPARRYKENGIRDKFQLDPGICLVDSVARAPTRRTEDLSSNPGSGENFSLKFEYLVLE